MADKKITDLQLRDNVEATLNIPSDDGIQSYRVTAAQIYLFILATARAAFTTISAAGTTLTSTNEVVLLDPTSAPFTQNLPAVASLPSGLVYVFKNIATNGNAVTLDASGSELIDTALTLVLVSTPAMDGVKLFNSGTKWLVI